jgi:AcrR family transcriptional regulator
MTRAASDPGQPDRRRRGQTGLNSEVIVTAALQLMDEQGPAALTMRRLAGALGVSPMSLYRHVDDKDDLLDQVLGAVVDRFQPPALPDAHWEEQVAEFFEALRRLLLEHPGIASLVADRAPRSTAWFRVVEQALRLVRAGGFEAEDAVSAFTALLLYTLGFVMWERPQAARPSSSDWARLRLGRLLTLSPEELPNVVELAPHLVTRATPEQFAWGLGRLITGLRAGTPPASPDPGTEALP